MKKMISFGFAALLAVSLFADVVALRNVAVVTAVGTAPTLPETVVGLKPDGTVNGEYEVSWSPSAAPTVAGITTVTGTAQVNGAAMSVTAFVRAVVPPSGELVNIAPLASSMTVDVDNADEINGHKGSFDVVAEAVNITNNWGGTVMKLNDWNSPKSVFACYWHNLQGSKITVDFAWNTTQQIKKIFIAEFNGNVHTGSRVLKDGSTGTEIPSSSYEYHYHYDRDYTYYKINSGDGFLYVFNSPLSLSALTIEFTAPPSAIANGIYGIEIFAEGGSGTVDPTSTDTLTALEVDNQSVPGFAADTMNYSIEGGQTITKAENDTDNVAVTILQKSVTASDNAYVVTLSEDAESTKTYAISMPPMHEHIFGEWQVITPATVYAPGLRRRVCTFEGCEVKEEEEIPQIPRKSVKWVDVDFANYTDGSTIADGQVDPVDGGTWAKPSSDDTATVAHGDPDPDLAALVVTNQYLCYAAKAQSAAGRDATIEFKAKFQKPNTDELPETLDLGQTAVFVFPDGKGSCYKAYTSTGWVKLTGATPDFEKFVTIKIEVRYNDGGRSAMVTIGDVVCTPVGATSPWFSLAGTAKNLTSVSFFGEFDLGNFWGEYLTIARGLMLIFQ